MNEENKPIPEEMSQEEYDATQQEAYYHYVIQEFYAICKVFGTKKVLEDLATFKATVEKPKSVVIPAGLLVGFLWDDV